MIHISHVSCRWPHSTAFVLVIAQVDIFVIITVRLYYYHDYMLCWVIRCLRSFRDGGITEGRSGTSQLQEEIQSFEEENENVSLCKLHG